MAAARTAAVSLGIRSPACSSENGGRGQLATECGDTKAAAGVAAVATAPLSSVRQEPSMPPVAESDPRPAGNAIERKLREVCSSSIRSIRRRSSRRISTGDVIRVENPLPRPPGGSAESVRPYFTYRAAITRLELRPLLKRGRTSWRSA